MYRYPNYDHLIAGLNSAIAQADQMDLSTAQTVDNITRALQRETEALDQIDVVHHQINQTGQVSIRDMNKVESIVSGTIDRAGGAQLFSFNPTANNLEGAVEAINWAKIGKIGIIGAIVAAILAIIYKIFKFMKSGKVDEIAKDIIKDQKKTEKSFNKAIVIPAIKRSGEMSIGDVDDPDAIDLDTMSADEIIRKLREAEEEKERNKSKKSPEELRKEKRYGNKLDISIPKTTGVVNGKLGTNFKEADLQKGFQSLLNNMQSAFMDGEAIGDKEEVGKMTVEAKKFLLDNVPKFKERRPQFALMLVCMNITNFSTAKLLGRDSVKIRLKHFEECGKSFIRLSKLSEQYKEIFLSLINGENKLEDWKGRHLLQNDLSKGHLRSDEVHGDRSKTLEDTVSALESSNYSMIPDALEYIAEYNIEADEDSFLVSLEQDIAALKKHAETFENPIKKLEVTVAEAFKWFDNIIDGNGVDEYVDPDSKNDSRMVETECKIIRSKANMVRFFLSEIIDSSRKALAQIMAYMKESQMILSYCMNGKGFHHELSETAGFIAMSMSKEIASRVSND